MWKEKYKLSRLPEEGAEKLCFDCGEVKMISEFYRSSSTKDGLGTYCKSCNSRRCKKYRDGPAHERLLEQKRQYYKDNIDAIKAQKAIYRERTREYKRAHDRQYYKENREMILEKQKEYARTRPAAVYKIENMRTGMIYIGQSTGYAQRWRIHRSELLLNKHGNPELQKDYNEFGLENFEFSVIKEYPSDTSSEELFEHEQKIIDKYLKEGRELYNKHRWV
tara:strand:- start:106 stop:768 length:663 start_codon:yes stop_codon:yes gene_type:complete